MISEKNEKKTNRLLNEKIVKFCLIPGILRRMSTIFSNPVHCVTKRSQHNELFDFNSLNRKVGLAHPTSRRASNALARLMEARVAKLRGLPYLGDHLRGRRSTRSTPTSGVVNQFINTLSTGRFPNRLGWIPTLLCPLRWLKRCTEVPHASTLIVPTSTLSYSRPASLDLSYIRRP